MREIKPFKIRYPSVWALYNILAAQVQNSLLEIY